MIGKGNPNGTLNDGAFYSIQDVDELMKGSVKTDTTPTPADAGKVLAVGADGQYELQTPGGTSGLPTPTVSDAGKVLGVDSSGQYALQSGGGGAGSDGIVYIPATDLEWGLKLDDDPVSGEKCGEAYLIYTPSKGTEEIGAMPDKNGKVGIVGLPNNEPTLPSSDYYLANFAYGAAMIFTSTWFNGALGDPSVSFVGYDFDTIPDAHGDEVYAFAITYAVMYVTE